MPLVLSFAPAQQVQAGTAPAEPVAVSRQLSAHAQTATPGFNSFGLTREVFGYATGGSLGDPTIGYPSWNFNLLSTVAFFAIRVNNQGILTADSNWNVWNSSTLTGLVSTAHAHGAKVVVTLRAGGADLCGALYGYQSTVDQIMIQVRDKGVDGVNIDYEGQLTTCPNPNPGQPNYTNQALLTNLARVLRQALNADRPGYYLSIATYSGSASGTDGFFNIPDLNQYVDSFFVMAYDMDYANQGLPPLQSCPSFCMAPISPLANYYWNDSTSMAQYASVVGAGKVILGQPYYGRVSCVASPTAHAHATSSVVAPTYLDAAAVYNSPDVRPGSYSINRDGEDPSGLNRWDVWYDLRLGCWREMYWSDVATLSNRYDLVNNNNLRGVGFWTLNYGGGATELWNAIQSHFVACMNASLTVNPAPPQLSATPVQLTGTSTACFNPRYEFWMQPPGGAWRVVQPYSTSATYSWNTQNYPPGTYVFSVWARDANSRNTYDSAFAFSYQLTTSPCTAMTASAAPPSGVVGNAVTITGAATGCPNPSYQFWVLPPGGSWTLVQSYSTSPNFAWNTIGWPAGTYLFSVWARDASSLGTAGSWPYTYDAVGTVQFALGVPKCGAVTATPNPATSANRGTGVTVTGTTSGCPRPMYQFWVKPPGGSWYVAQAYSSSSTFNWNTTGQALGSYYLSVWVRDAGSPGSGGTYPNTYDNFSAFQYQLTTAPCTAATTSAQPPSPASAGTMVTITATASGCPNPQYQFWVLSPGGTWTVAQPYSSSPTLTWPTTGLAKGSYLFSVWVRDASSNGTNGSAPYTYDAFSALNYTLT